MSRAPKRSKKPARPARPRAGAITDEMIRAAEAELGEMTLFEQSKPWALMKRVLGEGLSSLEAKRTAVLARVGVLQTDGQPLITTDVLARIEGEIARQKKLLRFVPDTIARWTEQLAQMRADQDRQRRQA